MERAVLDLFCDLTLAADLGINVGDVGCGTGRLAPYLAAKGLAPWGVDLSPEMIRVARRDYAAYRFDVADLRELPFEGASLVGVVCWYSLIFLAPADRQAAFGELYRVIKPGGYLVTAFKAGSSQVRRAGRSANLGVEFDLYWQTRRRWNDASEAIAKSLVGYWRLDGARSAKGAECDSRSMSSFHRDGAGQGGGVGAGIDVGRGSRSGSSRARSDAPTGSLAVVLPCRDSPVRPHPHLPR